MKPVRSFFSGRRFLPGCIAVLALVSCDMALPPQVSEVYQKLPDDLDYNHDVKPLLSDKCFACHGPDQGNRKAGLRLDMPEQAFAELPENPGKVAIDPGKWRSSEVVHRILSADPDYLMPTPDSHLSLSDEEKALILKWIKEGARYEPHWAFLKPEKAPLPRAKKRDWARNPIDHFVLEKMEAQQLAPAPEAGREILLRRLSLDLTGLPPTPEELDAFLADKSPDAYEKQVDRLLASPHYGEKMAVGWLDLARFADSHGYTVDMLRDMSPYRDWVIKAFNGNMPYDRFIHWQLAGDLMPDPTKDMLIATAFNRNHQQNAEGGIVEKEFQVEYVADRTNTLGDAFLGITLSCARCHDHKYDPITQKNYYELFSFFNNVMEAGQISFNNALPTPTMMLPTGEQEKVIRYISSKIAEQEEKMRALRDTAEAGFRKWLNAASYRSLKREEIPAAGLQAYYSFEKGSLANVLDKRQVADMRREGNRPGGEPEFEPGGKRPAILFNGDVWLDLKKPGIFRKSDPFSIALWVWLPEGLKEGVIFHKGIAERLYNYRGYHLYLRDGKLEAALAHTAPSEAIIRVSRDTVPRGEWMHLCMSYDGSSRAAGLRIHLNGEELRTDITVDQLRKDILLNFGQEPALQLGAWERGQGLKGGKISGIAVYGRQLSPNEIRILAERASWASAAEKSPGQLSKEEVDNLREYYFSAVAPELQRAGEELRNLRRSLSDSIAKVRELMVMQEMPERRPTFLLERGVYDAPREEVFPATPESIMSFPEDLPRNRYGLALWLTHEDNPLTARVAVNRIWQSFFGNGLVKTAQDFGNQGELPTHPELLDWLAVSFRESGWDVKGLIKQIVMSATYRQDSRAGEAAREKDPENRWLSRGPSGRMSAEMIRDNALAASGLINLEIGGPSIKPYQPKDLWAINSGHYVPDTGRAVYRRSVYVLIKRTVPNPTLASFDAPPRTSCVIRRQETNTPLQALVTLNDPTFVEASKVLGEQILRAPDLEQGIGDTFRKLTGRKALPEEIRLLEELYAAQHKRFTSDPAKVRGWLAAGQYVPGPDLDKAHLAAAAVVASTVLNSDACLTKR